MDAEQRSGVGDSSPHAATYRLSRTLAGHAADVRAVAAMSRELLITGSRDGCVRLWRGNELNSYGIRVHAPHYVQALAVLSNEMIVSGSSDKTVAWIDVNTEQMTHLGKGHGDVVSALAVAPTSTLVASGSWDRTVRLWRDGESLMSLTGHDAAVWALLFLSDTEVLSASADCSIRLWDVRKGECAQVLYGHDEAVRALCRLELSAHSRGSFASAGNDGSVILWSMHGEQIRRYPNVHGSFIYALAAFQDMLISASEDRTVRILDLQQQDVVQTIPHPNTVWSVTMIPNADGDFLTGCADSCARVWTRIPERSAPAEHVAEYEMALAAQKTSMHHQHQIDPSQVPDAETALAQPGFRDGQTRLVRKSGTLDGIEVYMWSTSAGRWMKIGDVTDPPGSPERPLKTGFDYVFDVDVDVDGSAHRYRQLGYRRGENPYVAAERFLEEEHLPRTYLEQIVQFLITHVPASDMRADAGALTDPLTGADRYVPPAASSLPQGHSAGNLPDWILFPGTDSYERILEHLPENDRCRSLFQTLKPLTAEKVRMLSALLERTPPAQAVAVIDLARLVVLENDAIQILFGNGQPTVLDSVLRHASSAEASFGIHVSSCRFICNSFVHWQRAPVREALLRCADLILDTFTIIVHSDTPEKLWRAFAAVLYNYAVLESRCDAGRQSVRSCADRVLQSACLLGFARPAGVQEASELTDALWMLIHDASRAQLAISAGLLEWEEVPSKIAERIRMFV